MLTFDLILYTVMLLASTAQPCQETKLSPSVPVLSEIVESFDVQNSTMEEALRALRQHDFANILIGFEKIAHREGERTESLSLSTKSATVGEILDKLCQQSKQYRYEIIEGGIIYVHPAHAESDPLGLLNIRISDFVVQGKMVPAAIIVRIGEFAPELNSYLDRKKNEYYSRRGISPASPGAIGHGNMDPNVNLHLRNMTLREILNATVVYSVRLRDETPADWTGNKPPTTSWMYEFVTNPDAPTGLGGTPRWVAF
jgi:hypothetical protein